MDLRHERTGRVDGGQVSGGRALPDGRADAVGAEDDDRVRRHLVDIVHEVDALIPEAIHDVLVVHDLVKDVDRLVRTDIQELIDDVDGHVDAGAEAARIGEDQFHGVSSSSRPSAFFRQGRVHHVIPERASIANAEASAWAGRVQSLRLQWALLAGESDVHPMSSVIVEQLATFGPDQCETLTLDEARGWCRRLAGGHYENFSVLSRLVPVRLRDDFAAVYAFCRWADDLGDETGDPDRSRELLEWWRHELEACFDGRPRHPVFVAMRPVVEAHALPIAPFADLISAFEQDQVVRRYETWAQLLAYCAGSANPVGRLVLMICGEPRTEAFFERSDEICTALQLTNHWQDVRRDVLERDRIYIPAELIEIDRFEERLIASARQGYAVDQTFLGEARALLRTCCERTWPLFESGAALIEQLGPVTRPIVWLLARGGQHVLRQIEMWNYETVLHRPQLGPAARLMLVAQAWWMAQRWRREEANSPGTST